MAISLDEDTAKELFIMKLKYIRQTLDEILNEWQIETAEEFINLAKNGQLEEAEMDGIAVKQLLADLEKYRDLLNQVN